MSSQGSIFISYRREDSADVTGRIYDQLSEAYGRNAIFKDVDNIPFGVDFRTHLDQAVSQCDILLAVIGKDWLHATDEKGNRRLDNPADFVRIEIEAALRRNIPVVPLLVRHASMPDPAELPESLVELAYRNGTPIRSDPDFHHDIERLIEGLQGYLVQSPPAPVIPTPVAPPVPEQQASVSSPVPVPRPAQKQPSSRIVIAILAAMLGGGVAIGAVVAILRSSTNIGWSPQTNDQQAKDFIVDETSPQCRIIQPSQGDAANIREAPDKDSKIIDHADRGDLALSLEVNPPFEQLKLGGDGVIGWVYNDQFVACNASNNNVPGETGNNTDAGDQTGNNGQTDTGKDPGDNQQPEDKGEWIYCRERWITGCRSKNDQYNTKTKEFKRAPVIKTPPPVIVNPSRTIDVSPTVDLDKLKQDDNLLKQD